MKKVIKLLMYALALGFVTGCATTSDIEKLQSQINGLNASVKQATVDAARAESAYFIIGGSTPSKPNGCGLIAKT
jgi:outer membrane murein-binding lipoprotein Lpp